jgi:hypothetical protein
MTDCIATEKEAETKATDPALRKQQVKALKYYYKLSHQRFEEWKAGGYQHPPPASIPYLEICRGMKCEAKTRSGRPCRNNGTNYSNDTCKFHGSASTDPVTPGGKKRVSMNSSKTKPDEKQLTDDAETIA